MNVLKQFGEAALDAASYITPKFVKNKVRDLTNWLYDYVDPTDLTQVLNEVKNHVIKTYRPFNAVESVSALNNFATQYTIKGRERWTILCQGKTDHHKSLRDNSQT